MTSLHPPSFQRNDFNFHLYRYSVYFNVFTSGVNETRGRKGEEERREKRGGVYTALPLCSLLRRPPQF